MARQAGQIQPGISTFGGLMVGSLLRQAHVSLSQNRGALLWTVSKRNQKSTKHQRPIFEKFQMSSVFSQMMFVGIPKKSAKPLV